MIQGCMSRLTRLELSMEDEHLRNAAWLHDTPAPAMVSLKLSVSPTASPAILSALFAWNMPRLESICLTGFRIPWDAQLFPRTLKEIYIDETYDLWSYSWPEPNSDEDDDEAPPPSAYLDHPRYTRDRDVLPIILRCDQLQSLHLRQCSNMRCGSAAALGTLVEAPMLRDLSLHASSVDCVHILSHLDVSKAAQIRLDVECGFKTGPYDDALPTLTQFPDAFFDILQSCPYITVSAASVSGSYTKAGGAGFDVRVDLFCQWLEGYPRETWQPRIDRVDNCLAVVGERMSLTHLKGLRILHHDSRLREPIQSKAVAKLLFELPRLRHIVLEGFGDKRGNMPKLWSYILKYCERPHLMACLKRWGSLEVKDCYVLHDPMYAFLSVLCAQSPRAYLSLANVEMDDKDARIQELVKPHFSMR
ncbi:hypothetical protein EIP91_004972 [Steccherinum ochraceum]|uniref:F-box domain-containing protein n=1 Tax=Steccherinum ochraceum TaxID=92696 RepID=A0A4V2MVT8_9APHY|nr:hypothetical protein EIP91_004972 [Steccherinum ochraceum]